MRKLAIVACLLLYMFVYSGCGGGDQAENGNGAAPTTTAGGVQTPTTGEGTETTAQQDSSTGRVPTPERMSFVLDGERVSLGVPPMRVEGIEMIPVNIFQVLGAFVSWDAVSQTVTVTTIDNIRIVFNVGSTSYTWEGGAGTMELAPVVVFGRVLVPTSFVEATMPIAFAWDDNAMILHGVTTGSADAVLNSQMGGGVSLLGQISPLERAAQNIIGDAAMPLPERRLAEGELEDWITQYMNSGGANSVENEIFARVNSLRAENDLPALLLDESLMRAARFKSQEMFDLQYFSHESPVYGSFENIPRLFGATDQALGENIALSSTATAQQLMSLWINSPGHLANMLNPL